jgi:hypothetical protein
VPLTTPAGTDPANYREAHLSYLDASGARNTVIFDAVTSETWAAPASVTEHPVETGANVADHVRVGLVTCSLTVRVSNEPLGSNQFQDPLPGLLSITVPTGLGPSGVAAVPTPTGTVLLVPQWLNNLDISEQIGIAAGIGSGLASGAAQAIADATPLGNAFASAIKPVVQVTQTGNDVIAYNTPQVSVGDVPIRSVGDLVGALVYEGITSLIPAGQEIFVPVETTAGLPAPQPGSQTAVVNVVQFAVGSGDFAAQMVELLSGLKDAAQQFHVFGSKNDLFPMVIETLSTRRAAPEDTGTGIEITIGFKQIRLVSTQTVSVPVPSTTTPRAAPPKEKGAQDGPEASTAVSESVLFAGIAAVKSLFGAPSPPSP